LAFQVFLESQFESPVSVLIDDDLGILEQRPHLFADDSNRKFINFLRVPEAFAVQLPFVDHEARIFEVLLIDSSKKGFPDLVGRSRKMKLEAHFLLKLKPQTANRTVACIGRKLIRKHYGGADK
jgi:hypothetical protein